MTNTTQNTTTQNKPAATQNKKVYAYLAGGATPTEGELRTRLNIKNPTAVIANLRAVLAEKRTVTDIYPNQRKSSKGKDVTRYSLGLRRGYREMFAPFGIVAEV